MNGTAVLTSPAGPPAVSTPVGPPPTTTENGARFVLAPRRLRRPSPVPDSTWLRSRWASSSVYSLNAFSLTPGTPKDAAVAPVATTR